MKIYLVSFSEGKIYEESQMYLDKTLKIAKIDEHIKWNFDKIKKFLNRSEFLQKVPLK